MKLLRRDEAAREAPAPIVAELRAALAPDRVHAGPTELSLYRHDGFWHPMDTSRDYKLLNDLWAGGKAPWRVW